jgi:CRISPR-associated endonuclease/helicase Cas3
MEIISDPVKLQKQLKRITVTLPADLNKRMQPADLVAQLSTHEKVLCIVNRRDECKELYHLMPAGTLHLSGYMCGEHRSEVISRIKKALKEGAPLRVVSTQIVETGVDIDFPVVFRALCGIDSIAQAGGRCNREGLLEHGDVFVFVSWRPTPRGHLSHMESACREVLNLNPADILSTDTFDRYFRHLYWIKGKEGLDKYSIVEDLRATQDLSIRFKEASTKFKIIDDSWQRNVFVRYGEGAKLIELLRHSGPDRWLLRKLQRFSVSLPLHVFNQLIQNGDVVEVYEGYFAQAFDGLYHAQTGLLGDHEEVLDPDFLIV